YAAERLERSGELGAVRARHARFFLALAEQAVEQWSGAEQTVWLNRLENEHDNMRAALDWLLAGKAGEQRSRGTGEQGTDAVASAPPPLCPSAPLPGEAALRLAGALRAFWETRGYLSEARSYLAAVLAMEGVGGATRERATALNGA